MNYFIGESNLWPKKHRISTARVTSGALVLVNCGWLLSPSSYWFNDNPKLRQSAFSAAFSGDRNYSLIVKMLICMCVRSRQNGGMLSHLLWLFNSHLALTGSHREDSNIQRAFLKHVDLCILLILKTSLRLSGYSKVDIQTPDISMHHR